MAKYIKELKYTDTATSTDYYVDTRAIKDADDTTKTLKQALDGKQASLPTTTIAGKALLSTATAGTLEWGEAGKVDDVTVDGTSVVTNKVAAISLSGKQDVLPTTTTAGKALISTSTAGTVEWGDAGKVDAITTGGKDLDPVDKKIEIDKVLTKAEYDALSSAEKKNGMNYYVTDESGIVASVVQSIGSSTLDVMSQNAVTEALGGKQSALPTTSTAGKVLKSTNTAGNIEWGDVDGLPSQEGQSGKFLTTNGINASWGDVPSVVQATGSSTTDVMSQNAVTTELGTKLDIAQGSANVGKVPKVNASGNLEMAEIEGSYGIATNPVMRRKKTVKATTVELLWDDPEDSYTEGIALSVWTKTVIVKKQGSLPANVKDGTTVVTVTTRNQYSETPYVDTQSDGDQWYYRAFPYSEGGIVSTSRLNDFQFWICGVTINDNVADSSAKVTPIAGCDNYYMGKPAMNRATDTFDYAGWKSIDRVPYAPKPCMLKSDGTVDYYLDKNDHTKKEDGTASDVANSSYDGNAMVEWDKIWLKVVSNGSLCNVYICSEQLDNDFVQWAYSNVDGYKDKKYLPMFEGSVISSKMRSLATGAKPTGGTTMSNEMTYAKANGTGWTITRHATEMLMQAVALVFFCDTNGQNKLGVASPSTAESLQWKCGNLTNKGALYGAASGYGGNNKFFYMEHWWGHRWRRFAGMTTDSSRKVYVKLTYGSTDDGSTTTDFITSNTMADYTSAYYDTGVVMASSSNPSWIQAVSKGARTFGLPVVSGGSATTYFCDGHWQGAAPCGPRVGGSVYNGLSSGVFTLYCGNAPSSSCWDLGASLEF